MKRLIVMWALGCAACAPEIDVVPGSNVALEAGKLSLRLEPEGALEASPPVTWLVVEAEHDLDPDRFDLFTGEMRSGHLSQLTKGAISQALASRIVPTLRWRDGKRIIVAPLVALEVGAVYAVATGEPAWAGHLTVTSDDPVPLLELVFPPAGHSFGHPFAIWCGDAPLPTVEQGLALAPDGRPSTLSRGASAEGGAHCLRLDAASGAGPVVPPPVVALADGTILARLEPAALQTGGEPATPEAAPCPAGESLAGACLAVFDDRALLSPPAPPLLWVATGPGGLDAVQITEGYGRYIWPLPPQSSFGLRLTRVDGAGDALTNEIFVTTGPPSPHVILSEIYADALGPEPQQEWVEIHNDGLVAADLEGWVLADNGGETVFPSASLAPGQTAVVVRDDFDELYPWDATPPPGTLLIRVPEIGKSGLANGGEPLELRDAQGAVVSRFPPIPKPKAGHSVVRVHPQATDDDPASFVRSDAPTPGTLP